MNQQTTIGNLVRDPETGVTDGGVNWCRFTVAVRKKYHREGEPDADFIEVTAWRGLGDTCAKYLEKGRKVCVVGVPKASAWIGKDGKAKGQIKLTADEVEFLSGGGGGSQAPTDDDAPPAPGGSADPVDPQSGMTVVDPEEQPF
jgi:single-strand DNA-binding protein